MLGPCVGQGAIIKRNSMAVELSFEFGQEQVIESSEAGAHNPVDVGDTSSIHFPSSFAPSAVICCQYVTLTKPYITAEHFCFR